MPRLTQPSEALGYARTQEGLISAHQCDELGISSARRSTLVDHGIWARLTRGVYDTGLIPRSELSLDGARRRTAWTALLALGPDSIATGACALALLGVWGLPVTLVPEATLAGARSVPGPVGIYVRRYRDVPIARRVNGFGVSDARTALVHALPQLSRESGVAVLDSALHLGHLRAGELSELRERMRGRRGVRRLRTWWDLVDGRAESPLETWARLDCHDHDLPPDELQVPVHSVAGAFLGRGDMGWRRSDGGWVIAELDGRETHGSLEALFHDRRRQNHMLLEPGITVLRFTSRDVRARGTIAAAVQRGLTYPR